MIILSNDGQANVPGTKSILSGGRSRFARLFSNFVIQKNHRWIGVISKIVESDKPRAQRIRAGKNREYWQLSTPQQYNRRLRYAQTKISAEEIYRPVIDKCKKIIETTKPDIIFINGTSSFPWIFLTAGHEMNIPIVTQHAGILKAEITRRKNKLTARGLKLICDMEKDFAKFSDRNIFISRLSQRIFNRQLCRIKPAQSTVISLPYDPKFIVKKKNKQNPKSDLQIGIVARWDDIKNHEAVIRLAKLAKKKKLPWTFQAVTEIYPNKKQAALQQEYQRYIKIKKPGDIKMLKKFYSQMDMMILPSHLETLGFVVMEAALSGTATIISPHVGWVDDYQKLKMSDWIGDFNKPQSILATIRKNLNKGVPHQFLKFILKNNKPEIIFNQYIKLFRQSIEKHQSQI